MSPIALRNLHGARPMLISHTPHEACPLPEIAEPSPLTLGGSFFSPQRSTRISQKALDELREIQGAPQTGVHGGRRDSQDAGGGGGGGGDLEHALPLLLQTQQLFSQKRQSLSSVVHQRFKKQHEEAKRSFTPTPRSPGIGMLSPQRQVLDPATEELFENLKKDALMASREAARDPVVKQLATRPFQDTDLQKLLTKVLDKKKLVRPIGVFKRKGERDEKRSSIARTVIEEGLALLQSKNTEGGGDSLSPRGVQERLRSPRDEGGRLASGIREKRRAESRPLVRRIIPQRLQRITPIRELRPSPPPPPPRQKARQNRRKSNQMQQQEEDQFLPEPWGDSPTKGLFYQEQPSPEKWVRSPKDADFGAAVKLFRGGRRDAGTFMD